MPKQSVDDEPALIENDPFPGLNRKLKLNQEVISTDASSDLCGILRYVKFTIAGVPGEKQAVFIPEDLQLSTPVLSQICDALGKEMPSMMLSGVGNMCHPSSLSTKHLRECPGFAPIMNEARASMGIADDSTGMSSLLNACMNVQGNQRSARAVSPSREDPHSRALDDFANSVLEQKATSMVCAAANAAFQTNAWTFSGPQISNFEIILQRCVDNGDTEIFKTVAAHMQDKSYKESKFAISLFQQLFQNSHMLTSEIVDSSLPLALPGDLWNKQKNRANKEFAEYGFDYWSFESFDEKAAQGHPIVQWPWPYGDLFFFFYRAKGNTGAAGAEVDWDYTTDKRLNREAVPFQPDMLAPPGYVFIGGNAKTKGKMLQVMQAARPTVIFDNTPSSSKQMSLFLNIVKRVMERPPISYVRPFLIDAAFSRLSSTPTSQELLQALSPAKIARHIASQFDPSGMHRGAQITLSDVVSLLDLVRQRPQVFKETIQVVDPLRDAPEAVLSQLSSAFCSTYTGALELGAGSVNRNLILKGWRLHAKLVQSAHQLRVFAVGMMMLISLVMLLCTMFAMILVYIRLQKNSFAEAEVTATLPMGGQVEVFLSYKNIASLLNIFMLVLPISAGLLTTLQSHFQFSQRWSGIHMASNQVVAEIYQFLGSVGRYSTVRYNPALTRQRFLKRLQDIVTSLSMSGIREGVDSTDDADLFVNDSEALLHHINLTLYGIQPPSWLRRKCKDIYYFFNGMVVMGQQGAVALLEDSSGMSQNRDLMAPLSADLYLETRITPLIKCYSDKVKSMTALRTGLIVTVFVLLALGSLFAAVGYSLWIPVTVGTATCVTTLLHFLVPLEGISAVNNALTELNNLDLRWHGSALKDQRSELMKNRLITITESVMLAVSVTSSRAPLLSDDIDETDDFDDSEFGDGDFLVSMSRRDGRSRSNSMAHTPGSRTPLYSRSGSRSRQNSAPGTPGRRTPGGSRRGGGWVYE